MGTGQRSVPRHKDHSVRGGHVYLDEIKKGAVVSAPMHHQLSCRLLLWGSPWPST